VSSVLPTVSLASIAACARAASASSNSWPMTGRSRPAAASARAIRASGRFAPVTPELAQDRQVTVRAGAGASPEELAALARTALAEAAAGRLRPVIGQEFELAGAARAHAAIEARETVGKTLLTVP